MKNEKGISKSVKFLNNPNKYQLPSPSETYWFRRKVIIWYQRNGRNFPWRSSQDPYFICIAEIMLQQTSADRVARTITTFVERFPDWKALVEADISEIENFLFPLGIFRRRASVIQSLAKSIRVCGGLPANRKELEQLPGIGQYIASVLLATFYKKREPFLDVNMSRVLERFFGPRQLADIRYDPYLQTLSRKIISAKAILTTNWMILDFAALVCFKIKPNCISCILKKRCKHINQYQDANIK